jgi:hypothetical protein
MESTVQLQWAFSNNKQSAYATALANGSVDQGHPFEGADFGDHMPNMSDNAAQFGKGHEFASRMEILSWDSKFKRSFQATTKMLGWAFAFHCGKDTYTSLGGAPAAHQHVFEFQDPLGTGYYGSGRQQPVTTIIERVASGQCRKFPSMAVKSVEVTGALNDWLKMSVELQGSGMKTDITPVSGFAFPAPTEGALLRTASLAFSHGVSGSMSDISVDVRSFRFRSEYAYDENGGYFPGSGYIGATPSTGQVRGKLEFTKRAVMFEAVITATNPNAAVFFGRLEAATETSALLTVTGDTISGGNANKLIISLTKLKYKTVEIAADGDIVTYHITGVVFFDAAQGTNTGLPGNPYTVTVVNTTGNVYIA